MPYLDEETIKCMGFKKLGKNVKISDKAAIYNTDEISIGDNSRIDDFCIISGKVDIGDYCHITPMCLVAGGTPGVKIGNFSTLAYGVKVFSQSDDYSGNSMVNSLVPKKYKKEIFKRIEIGNQVIIGAGAVVFPGAHIAEGCSIGAMALVTKETESWGIYAGIPAKRIKDRSKNIIEIERLFLREINNDPI